MWLKGIGQYEAFSGNWRLYAGRKLHSDDRLIKSIGMSTRTEMAGMKSFKLSLVYYYILIIVSCILI